MFEFVSVLLNGVNPWAIIWAIIWIVILISIVKLHMHGIGFGYVHVHPFTKAQKVNHTGLLGFLLCLNIAVAGLTISSQTLALQSEYNKQLENSTITLWTALNKSVEFHQTSISACKDSVYALENEMEVWKNNVDKKHNEEIIKMMALTYKLMKQANQAGEEYVMDIYNDGVRFKSKNANNIM